MQKVALLHADEGRLVVRIYVLNEEDLKELMQKADTMNIV